MANWAYIENGEIKQLVDYLPQVWENSLGSHLGFHLSANNLPWLKEQGWLPVQNVLVSVDVENEIVTHNEYQIEDNQVLCTQIKRPLTEQEKLDRQQFKILSLFMDLRSQRNVLLQHSDWTQAIDLQTLYSEEWKTKWKEYRQKLRDLPTRVANEGIIDYNMIPWPEIPNVTS